MKILSKILIVFTLFLSSATFSFAEESELNETATSELPVGEVLTETEPVSTAEPEKVIEETEVGEVEAKEDESESLETTAEAEEIAPTEIENTGTTLETETRNADDGTIESPIVDGMEEGKPIPVGAGFRLANAPITLAFSNYDKTAAMDKEYANLSDTLGIPDGWGLSDWHIRTYRRIFLGWTPVKDYTGANGERIYSHGDTVKSVLDNGDGDKVLYPVYAGMFDALGLESELTGEITINKTFSDKVTLPNAEIKNSTGFGDDASVEKKATVYYNPNTDRYHLNLDTEFSFGNNKVAAIVAANPVGLLKLAKKPSEFLDENEAKEYFKGATPKEEYSYVDLHVILDENLDVATTFKNLTFSSGTFMARAVLDENYEVLSIVDKLPENGALSSTFNFENPNKSKHFIIRTTLRNANQDSGGDNRYEENPYRTNHLSSEYIFGPMHLSGGEVTNVTISKEEAEKYKDTDRELIITGYIEGAAAVRTNILPFPFSMLAPKKMKIKKVDSNNTVNVNFVSDDRPKPQPKEQTGKVIPVKVTCEDEGKVWSEDKQACIVRRPSVPKTDSSNTAALYFAMVLIAAVGVAKLNLSVKK